LAEIALRSIHRHAPENSQRYPHQRQSKTKKDHEQPGCSPCDSPAIDPSCLQTFEKFEALKRSVPDPTTLILVDKADCLQMNSLEMMRLSFFDKGNSGMALIGMPGIEKRFARFPQFCSRTGFVHEFRSLEEPKSKNY
jgi:hypothetical protein